MRYLKEKKGVTLTTLVIVIIVLLILLAVLFFSSTGETNVVENANTAVTEYDKSVSDEQKVLNHVENVITVRSNSISKSEPVMSIDDVKLTYTVSYNANGGRGEMADQKVVYNESFTPKENGFTRAGYSFKGWNTNKDGSGDNWVAGSAQNYTKEKSIILYAQWEADELVFESQNINKSYSTGGQTIKITGTIILISLFSLIEIC